MAIYVKNLATGETKKVNNVRVNDGEIVAEWQCNEPKVGGVFDRNYPFLKRTEKTQHHEARNRDCRVFVLEDGYELVKKEKGERKPRQPKTEKGEPMTEDEQPENIEVVDEPKDDTKNEQALIAALKNLRGGAVDAKKVRKIVAEELAKIQPQTKEIAVVAIDGTETGRVETPHKLLSKVLRWVKNDRVNKRQPWLFGPAGSGKSTIAEQVAKAMNLPLYIYTNVQQKYEIEGFVGADGKLVETPMYKAMLHGGIVLCDEMGTWLPEPATAFNTITANKRYTFPVVGTVEAHPDFHIIAADNTTGRGGSRKYSARYKLDASTLDRFKFLEVPYTDEHDLFMAQGDSELVAFAKDLRRVLDEAQSEYECTPRALLDIKTGEQIEDSEKDALYYGLCSGWNKQDIRTFAERLTCRNKYGKLFNEIANNI